MKEIFAFIVDIPPKNKDVRDTSKEQFIKMVTEISKKYWNKKNFYYHRY